MKKFLKQIIYGEKSTKKLALSFAAGIYIAFSPYLGLHNVMIFVFSWIFRLNTITTFTIAHINNPITTVPVCGICYMFGKWLLNDIFGITLNYTNPSWINYINNNLFHYFGIPKICFWTFFIGANLLGLVLAILSYPIMKFIFKKLIKEKNNQVTN